MYKRRTVSKQRTLSSLRTFKTQRVTSFPITSFYQVMISTQNIILETLSTQVIFFEVTCLQSTLVSIWSTRKTILTMMKWTLSNG